MEKRKIGGFGYRIIRFAMWPVYRKPKFVGIENITEPTVIISNHVKSRGPVLYCQFFPYKFALWATHEICENLRSCFHYLRDAYFAGKLKWNRFFATVVGFVGAPLVHSVLKLALSIPVYRDKRLIKTIKSSFDAYKEGNSIVLFPEDSVNDGYDEKPKNYLIGFVIMCEYFLKKGVDVPLAPANIKVKKRKIFFGEVERFSEISEKCGGDRQAIADYIRDKSNSLGGE
ncbi:MAG: hypothetical protein ILP02_03425 [Clostridia bacterium]|nr:hypothetical protein [Clostridia bacterium]